MTPLECLLRIERSCSEGSLPPLALALARLLHRLDSSVPASLLGAAALLVHGELRGHTALRLGDAEGLQERQPDPRDAGLAFWLAQLPGDAAAAQAAWSPSPLVQCQPEGARATQVGAAPLVLQGPRLALRRLWWAEQHAASMLRARVEAAAAAVPTAESASLLDRLFGPEVLQGPANAQRVAAELALSSRLLVVTGGPGTGKTWTAARLLVLLQAMAPDQPGAVPLRMALTAPTGKAAARLKETIESALQDLPMGDDDPVLRRLAAARVHIATALAQQPPRTLHAWLGARPLTRRMTHGASAPLAVDLMVVDEASMLDLELLTALLDALPAHARLVLLGDRDQLSSVEAGTVMTDLCAGGLAANTVTLQAGRRFDGPIAALAQAVNLGDVEAVQALLAAGTPTLRTLVPARPDALLALALGSEGYGPYLQQLERRPADADVFEAWVLQLLEFLDRFRLLTAVREGPFGTVALNVMLTETLTLGGADGATGWWEGRPVMVTRNEPALGVFNGDIGVTLRPPDKGPWRVWFREGGRLRSVAAARLAAVDTAWALTVHKSQGSEFGHVALVLPLEDATVLTRELLYTGLTRARHGLTLISPNPALLASALSRRTRRISGLAEALQQP